MRKIQIFAASLMILSGFMFTTNLAVHAEEINYYGSRASSVLDEPGYDHNAWCMYDDDLTTAWMEGADGHGYGEYVDFFMEECTVITGGTIYPGFYQDEDMFYKNNAPTMLYIHAGEQEAYLDVTEYATTYEENFNGYRFVFNEPLIAWDGEVRVTIVAVRPGWKYDDTCITELWFDGYQATSETVPQLPEGTPHASVALPADQEAHTQEIHEGGYPDFYLHPDGLGSDGRGPDEIEGTTDAEFLEFPLTQRLSYFASALYKLHCKSQHAQPKTIRSSDLYSYSRAYMLNWYQYNISDDRIISEGYSHYAYEEDLKEILDELFVNASVEEDLQTFCEEFSVSRRGTRIEMNATGDFGDGGSFYLTSPDVAERAGKRTVINGSVMEYRSSGNSYESVMPYKAYFIQDEENPSVFRFDELVVG